MSYYKSMQFTYLSHIGLWQVFLGLAYLQLILTKVPKMKIC